MFNEQLSEFFQALLDTQNPAIAKDDTSSTGTAGTSFSRTARTVQMSRLMSKQQSGFSIVSARKGINGHNGVGKGKCKAGLEREEKGMEAEAAMPRHVEQCEFLVSFGFCIGMLMLDSVLLRLDFNGVMSERAATEEIGTKSRYVLEEGGL